MRDEKYIMAYITMLAVSLKDETALKTNLSKNDRQHKNT